MTRVFITKFPDGKHERYFHRGGYNFMFCVAGRKGQRWEAYHWSYKVEAALKVRDKVARKLNRRGEFLYDEVQIITAWERLDGEGSSDDDTQMD